MKLVIKMPSIATIMDGTGRTKIFTAGTHEASIEVRGRPGNETKWVIFAAEHGIRVKDIERNPAELQLIN